MQLSGILLIRTKVLFMKKIRVSDQKDKHMSQIKLTPEDLRQSAQRYAQGSQDIDQILTTLTHEQQVIDANWDGSAFDSFEAQFNELSPKIKQFAQLLEDINGQLIKVADIVEQTDQDIAAQIH